MSTPVNQLKPTGAPASRSHNNDEEVQDVIRAMEMEVNTPQHPPQVTTTHMATVPTPPSSYPHPHQPHPQQQQQHPQQQPSQNYMPYPHPHPYPQSQLSFLEQYVNTQDAKTAVFAAIIALCFLYPSDTSFIYEKFSMLSNFQQYDLFIRTALLAAFLYILLQKL